MPSRPPRPPAAVALLGALLVLACAPTPRAGARAESAGTLPPVRRSEGPAPRPEMSVLAPGTLTVSAFTVPLPTLQQYVQTAFAAEDIQLRPFGPADTLLGSVPIQLRGREVTYRVRLVGPGPRWLVVLDGAYGAPGDTVRVIADRMGTRVAKDAWQRLFNVADRLNERRLQGP